MAMVGERSPPTVVIEQLKQVVARERPNPSRFPLDFLPRGNGCTVSPTLSPSVSCIPLFLSHLSLCLLLPPLAPFQEPPSCCMRALHWRLGLLTCVVCLYRLWKRQTVFLRFGQL